MNTSDHSDPFGNTYPVAGSPGPVYAATPGFAVPSQSPQPIHVTCVTQQAPRPSIGARFLGFCVSLVATAITWFVIAVIVVAAMNAGMEQKQGRELTEKFVLGDKAATDKILVLHIEGVIMDGLDSFIAKQIKQATADEDVKGIVLRVDSPGGSVVGSDYYLHLLKKMKSERKVPVLVSMGGMATSGGYYVAMAGDEIYAEPGTATGSIGVIVPLYKGVGLAEKIGIESAAITSGPLKGMGDFTKPMSEEERKVWQGLVDENFELFKQVIRDGRANFANEPEKLDALATGQIYTAKQALEHKLIDKLGYIDEVIAEVMNRANVSFNPDNPLSGCKVVRYKKKQSVLETLMEGRSRAGVSLDLAGLEASLGSLTTPKAYFLCPGVLPLGERP